MNRARDRRVNDPAYIQWQKEYAAEQAATPEAQFQRAANAEAEANRQTVLTARLTEEYLSQFGTVVRPPFNEAHVAFAMEKFKSEADYIRSRNNAIVLVEFMDRNLLSPADPASYLLAHAILKLWSAYPDEVAPVEVEPVVIDTRTPSEIAEAKYKSRMTEIVVYDPNTNIGYTEFDLENKVDSKTELRLRRLMEGRIGNNLYDVYMEIQNIKAQQAAEKARKAQEEAQ